jgi:phosphoribosylamine--glycine ligase
VEAAELELDRAKGQAAMKKAGLNIIPGVEFHDYDAAARFVEKNPQYLVSKPSGDADKALSYVAPNAAALLYMFERWRKTRSTCATRRSTASSCRRRRRLRDGRGRLVRARRLVAYFYENFEFKKLMAGDLGPNTGEMGTLSMYVKKSKLADIALKPMTKALKALDYVGFCDVSGMIDERGEFWPFEFTMRPGWPTFHNQMATHEGDPAQWMVDKLQGKDTLKVRENRPASPWCSRSRTSPTRSSRTRRSPTSRCTSTTPTRTPCTSRR